MKNVINFTGNNVEFKTFLDNAKEAVKDRKNLEFPYYVCENCGFSAWTVNAIDKEHRCSECGFPVKLITTINNTEIKDKHLSEEVEDEFKSTELITTRYGFKKA